MIIVGTFLAGYSWRGNRVANEINHSSTQQSLSLNQPGSEKIDGKGLAQIYCTACHVFPEPQLLTKTEWRHHVMPQVALRMGIESANYESLPDGKLLREAGIFPVSPMLKVEEWLAIWDYYQAEAPASPLPSPYKTLITSDLKNFRAKKVKFSSGIPTTTLVKIDPTRRQLCVGDMYAGVLGVLEPDGKIARTVRLGTAPVSLVPKSSGYLITSIGRFYPSDALEGSVMFVPRDAQASSLPLLQQLRRPTDALMGDLNQDGREDLVVCSFGNRLGQFAWYENTGDGRFSETVLLDRPGATRCELRDLNRDGRMDIVVLCGQAREGIYIFYNQGRGQFTVETVFEQHPAFGLVDFAFTDFNWDGAPDLVVVNGDNGDISTPHKAYHGVRIFMNDGKNHFAQTWFYPLEGAYKALPADYDQDGDIDLTAIAFFPDFSAEKLESFVFLENQGAMNFVPRTLEEQKSGRWMVMDAGDIDQDGDVDLALGSFIPGPTTIPVPESLREHWQKEGAALLILENLTR